MNVITNVGQLFEALAEGWEQDSLDNRILIAGDYGQFVRVPAPFEYPFHKRWRRDISVESGNYSMRGFIRFETRRLFPGLFNVSAADDGAWIAAELTMEGFAIASAGVLPFKSGENDPHIAFFAMPEKHIATDALTDSTGASHVHDQ